MESQLKTRKRNPAGSKLAAAPYLSADQLSAPLSLQFQFMIHHQQERRANVSLRRCVRLLLLSDWGAQFLARPCPYSDLPLPRDASQAASLR